VPTTTRHQIDSYGVEETALVHNGLMHTPPHEQTQEQKQTHPTQHTTDYNHMGEETEAGRRHLCRRHRRCATPWRDLLQEPMTLWAPPPWDCRPQTTQTWPSTPQIPRSFSTHSYHSTWDAHWSWPLCVGVSPLPPPLSLPRTQVTNAAKRASPPPRHH
jgi:hypothetical protein